MLRWISLVFGCVTVAFVSAILFAPTHLATLHHSSDVVVYLFIFTVFPSVALCGILFIIGLSKRYDLEPWAIVYLSALTLVALDQMLVQRLVFERRFIDLADFFVFLAHGIFFLGIPLGTGILCIWFFFQRGLTLKE